MSTITPFHIAIPVRDLEEARVFYTNVLHCKEGRSSEQWIDFNLYGHQLVVHHRPMISNQELAVNQVDGQGVPIPHYGVVLKWEDWEVLAERLKEHITFEIEPYIRFKGEAGEQATLFFCDPSGNALEFKAFKNMDALFAK